MQREFNVAEQDFRQQLTAFFTGLESAAGRVSLSAFKGAVCARGWSVPTWPQSAGGPGWNAAQIFIWLQACAAHGIDVEADPGVWIVGPLLFHRATNSQQQRFLPGIRELQAQWCIGLVEPDAATVVDQLSATSRAGKREYLLNGTKTWVVDGVNAQWMCCLARLDPGHGDEDFALFAVDMRSQGLQVQAIKTLDGAVSMAEVRFIDVLVGSENLLVGPAESQALAQLLSADEYAALSRSAVARIQLEVIDMSLAALDPGDAVHSTRNQLAIDLAGLEALELRYLDALGRAEEPPVPLTMLRMKSREILLQLGALQLECFGYYALPYPDERLLHNEGPIGPEDTVATLRRTWVQQVAAIYEGSTESLKDELARQLEIEDD